MYDRKEVKRRARGEFQANYWLCVLIALILALFVFSDSGTGVSSVYSRLSSDESATATILNMNEGNPIMEFGAGENSESAREGFRIYLYGIYGMMPAAMQSYLNNCDGSQKKDVLHILSELTDRTGFDSAVHTVEQAIRYEAHDPDSLRSLYNSIFSDVPQLPPLTSGGLIPELDPMPVHLEDYDRFLKGGGDLSA